MARILIIHTGLTGILNASFELVHRLEKTGYNCVLATPKKVEKKVEAQGIQYLQLDPVNFDPAPELPNYSGPLRKVSRVIHKYAKAGSRKEQAIENLGMDAFWEKVQSVNPDLVIIDIELHEHLMTLHVNGVNMVLLSQWFSTWNRKGLPPIVSDIIPGEGETGTPEAIEKSWEHLIADRHKMFEKIRIRSAGTDRRSILLEYANKIGFAQDYIKENYWPGPVSYAQLPVLSITEKALEFPHDVRPNLHYVGALVSTNRIERIPAADQEKIIGILSETKHNRKKLIYCSVSTFKAGDTTFLDNVIAAVSGNENWNLIIGLGGQIKSGNFQNLPENVFAFSRVPQLEVLANADLSINHGGIHTINECLHFKVPMLVYSGKRSDQNGCAARMQFHGIGRMADKDLDGTEEIRNKIDACLQSELFSQQMEKFNKIYLEQQTDNLLGETISRFLKSTVEHE